MFNLTDPTPVGAGNRRYVPVTIANGASLSSDVHIGAGSLAGIVMPAAWTTADLVLQVSWNGTHWNDYFDGVTGNQVILKADAGRRLRLNVADFLDVERLRLRSVQVGTPANAVNQGAARDLVLVVVP